jgi:hypothetical protein
MQDPMPLKNLPGYLKSLRENNSVGGDAPVVDMGNIVTPIPWGRYMTYVTAACLFLSAGILTYNNVFNTKNVTLVISAKDSDIQSVSNALAGNGGKVLSIEKNEYGEYEVKMLTKNVNWLLDRLRRNKEFNKVEVEE